MGKFTFLTVCIEECIKNIKATEELQGIPTENTHIEFAGQQLWRYKKYTCFLIEHLLINYKL